MTTTTAAGKLVAVAQQLRAGHSPRQVAESLGLTEDQVRDLARDIPGLTAPRPAPAPIPRGTVSVAPAPQPPAAAPQPLAAPSPIARRLEDASQHSVARVRNLAARIETQLEQLRVLMYEHEEAEAARRAEAEAKQKAKAEVARLEAQLAAAKAKLRGKPTAATARTASGTTDVACGKCGRTYSYAKSRDKHQATCTASA